jgi:hypothetical protein
MRRTQISNPFCTEQALSLTFTVERTQGKGCLRGEEGSKRKALIQAVGWKLKDSDAKACLERIERYKNTLSLAISANEA